MRWLSTKWAVLADVERVRIIRKQRKNLEKKANRGSRGVFCREI